MRSSLLVRLLGFPATLIHGDTLVWDRWRWLKYRLPETRNEEQLLDVGCGTGAFTIGAALRGYHALGLSWDSANNTVAEERARLSGATTARFEQCDVRQLHTRTDLVNRFEVVVCCENIEHIIDDRKLMSDMAACLKPGGRLLLTAPYLLYRPLSEGDKGPFSKTEDGWHVRRGYSSAMLEELCQETGLQLERVSYCSGFWSQRITIILRWLESWHHALAWASILPLRLVPPVLDPIFDRVSSWPSYSICLEAYKPRFSSDGYASPHRCTPSV